MAASIFGCIVPGRLVITDCQQVSEAQFLFNLDNYDSINHVVVFMTGAAPFPEGLGGSVYLCWPVPEPSWHLLGFISNDKPSAIFKIAKPKQTATPSVNPFSGFQQTTTATNPSAVMPAQIGISIEPAHEIINKQTSVTNNALNTQSNFVQFTQAMMQSCYNYCSSFAVPQAQMTPQPLEQFAPLSALTKWYENFQRKMDRDPNFWKS